MSINKSAHPDSHRALVKSTSTLSAGTLTSRILGFLRDIILAKLLGTGMKADAFFVALKIPNLLRDMIGEGAANAAVIPVLSDYLHKKEKQEFWKLVNVLFSWGLIILSTITILGILLTPLLVRLIAPGFIAEPEKLELTIRLTKWMFPYLVLIGLTAYSMGVLYAFRSFWVPAFSPCLFNIAIIISAYAASRTMAEPVLGLAIGVLMGGVLQLAAEIWPLKKVGMVLKVPQNLSHPGAKQIGRLLLPRMVGSGVYQLTVFVDTFCASLSSIVGPGGISAIYYANRILQFPMGIFSVALASAVLPTFSSFVSKNDMTSFRRTLIFSLKNVLFILFPMMVMLLILAQPIIQIFFQRGEFNAYSTQITSWTLSFYASGIISFGGIKILVTAFYAWQDTKTPVKVAALCLLINTALNFLLMGPLKVGGIALASSIAGTINFLVLFYFMDKRLGVLNLALLIYFLKVTTAAMILGVFVYLGWQHFPFPGNLWKLGFVGLTGFLLYFFVCLLLRIEQAQKIGDWIFRIQNDTAR